MTLEAPFSCSWRLTWAAAGLALVLFFPLFITGGLGRLDFWWWMASNAAVLTALAAATDSGWRLELVSDLEDRSLLKAGVGLGSALLLYGVFFAGSLLSRRLFSFAAGGIDDVYGFRTGVSVARVALLMAFVIGPGEELFWRGFLQRRLQAHYGRRAGLAAAAGLYTLVHAGSMNPMLILAALTAGLAWGGLYLRFRSMLVNIISHVIWDLAVFIVFPFT